MSAEPVITIKDFPLRIKSAAVVFADGSKVPCEYESIYGERCCKAFKYKCPDAIVEVHAVIDENVCTLGFSLASLRDLSQDFPLEIDLEVEKPRRILALTTHRDFAKHHVAAFGYYNQIAVEKEPKAPKPTKSPVYPPEYGYITHDEYARSYPCWTYPAFIGGFENIPPYSVFLMADYEGKYMALLSLSDRVTAYINPNLKIKLFSGKITRNIELNWFASISVDTDPYKAIKTCVCCAASNFIVFKPREAKKQPIFMEEIGWCSWNALLTEDLSHENVVGIVKGLVSRGLNLGWVIIDDGWQNEVKREGLHRSLSKLSANERFPGNILGVAGDLKKIGIHLVGLWHTINLHWGGFEEGVYRELSAGFLSSFLGGYVPPPTLDEAFKLYRRFFSWVKSQGIDFVKIDNQWIIHALYNDASLVGDASRSIELSMQAAAYANGLDILNCMSMAPENYSNFLFSNIMRVSMDYIPFWVADAKLHTLFSVYNALVFSHVAYPDYDMFMSYDPYAKVHVVARVFSGGPIYIADRLPEKTDMALLGKFVLSDGSLVKVDEPALPTRDILFKDPYNEPVLLKVASRVGEGISIAVFNINKRDGKIKEEFSLKVLPFDVEHESYVYYKVFSGELDLLGVNEKVRVSLDDPDVEVIALAPIIDGKAVIGLREYLLPQKLVRIFREPNGKVLVESLASGILVYYSNGVFQEIRVEKGSMVKI